MSNKDYHQDFRWNQPVVRSPSGRVIAQASSAAMAKKIASALNTARAIDQHKQTMSSLTSLK